MGDRLGIPDAVSFFSMFQNMSFRVNPILYVLLISVSLQKGTNRPEQRMSLNGSQRGAAPPSTAPCPKLRSSADDSILQHRQLLKLRPALDQYGHSTVMVSDTDLRRMS